MALVVNDRVKETSTTAGTGTFTLDGAVTGFETFSSAIGNGNTTYYAIEIPNTTEFEVGLGTVAAGTLARTTGGVISSSNSDALVNFSAGTKNVFCTLPASKAVIKDASGNVILGANKVIEFGDAGENISGNGTDLEINSSGKILLDADAAGEVHIQDNNTTLIKFFQFSNFVTLESTVVNKDFHIRGNDGGSTINALSFDMSEAGAATFNDKVILNANKVIEFGDSGETISGDGTSLTIASSHNTVIDSTNQIILDAGNGANIFFRDDGTLIGQVLSSGNNDFKLKALQNAKDLIFEGLDSGGSLVAALTLDMSEAGAATFNDKVILGANKVIEFGNAGENISGDGTDLTISASSAMLIDVGTTLTLDGATQIALSDSGTNYGAFSTASNAFRMTSQISDNDILFRGNDGGSFFTALTLDMSEAGAATFNSNVTVGANLDVSSGTIKLDGNYPTGTNNVAIGDNALNSLTSGQDNTCIGHDTGTALQDGSDNTFIGESAGAAMTSGNTNTAVGGSALKAAATVANTVAIGQDAGLILTSGDRNTFVGRTAGSTANGGNNNICLGYNAEPSSANINNEITLGDSQVDRFRIPGLQSGASNGDVLTYDGTKIVLSTPSTGVSAGFAVAMAIAL
jgi:hypothetical protein